MLKLKTLATEELACVREEREWKCGELSVRSVELVSCEKRRQKVGCEGD